MRLDGAQAMQLSNTTMLRTGKGWVLAMLAKLRVAPVPLRAFACPCAWRCSECIGTRDIRPSPATRVSDLASGADRTRDMRYPGFE